MWRNYNGFRLRYRAFPAHNASIPNTARTERTKIKEGLGLSLFRPRQSAQACNRFDHLQALRGGAFRCRAFAFDIRNKDSQLDQQGHAVSKRALLPFGRAAAPCTL